MANKITIPYTFVAGTPANANSVNSNFSTVAEGLNAAIDEVNDINVNLSPATEYKAGFVRIATDEEAAAETDNTVAITPLKMALRANTSLSNLTDAGVGFLAALPHSNMQLFTASGSFDAPTTGNYTVICVGGGGAGGGFGGVLGAGGGGGYVTIGTATLIKGEQYPVIVGAGGVQGSTAPGGTTSFAGIIAIGGDTGLPQNTGTPNGVYGTRGNAAGGCGGGASTTAANGIGGAAFCGYGGGGGGGYYGTPTTITEGVGYRGSGNGANGNRVGANWNSGGAGGHGAVFIFW